MTLESQNDQTRLKRVIELLEVIGRMEFQTEPGKEFHSTITVALDEIIKPQARTIYKQLNEK